MRPSKVEGLHFHTWLSIPSLVSSTIGGNLIGNREYLKAVILFSLTGALSLIGLKLYNAVMKKLYEKAKKRGHLFKSFHKNNKEL